jgi:hypothetical protein
MSNNPAPGVITDPVWRFWVEFDAAEPTALLGGIFADKRGYHNTRKRNQQKWPDDYSIRLALDKLGPSDKSGGIDLTMNTAAMKKYTARLDKAAKAKDKRLYLNGEPVIREFIGTKDGKNVYCYDLAKRREDHTRDSTHLWHVHISFTRKYVNNWKALSGVLDVLLDRSSTQEEKEMSWTDSIKNTVYPTSETASGDAQSAGNRLVITQGRTGEILKQLEAFRNNAIPMLTAILEASQGASTEEITAKLDQHFAAETERDASTTASLNQVNTALAEIKSLVEQAESGQMDADEVVRRMGERLSQLPTTV